jgi:hypothetical protein
MADAPGFSDYLPQMQRGVTDLELADELQKVVLAATKTGKSGKLSITVTVTPNGEEMVYLGLDISTKCPVNRPNTLFFVDEQGRLSRQSPRQLDIPFNREDPD